MLDERVLTVLQRLEDEEAHESSAAVPYELRCLACGPETGRVLFALAAAATGARILEIGGSRGYSTVWLAAGSRLSGGSVVSLEQDPAKAEAWRQNLADAGLDGHAVLVEGDALQTLARLEERFAVVFIDAWKPDYELYFTAARTLAIPGTLVLADNVRSHEGLAGYVARRQADPTLVSVTLPLGNGVEVTTILTP